LGQIFSALSQCTRSTDREKDGETDTFLVASPRSAKKMETLRHVDKIDIEADDTIRFDISISNKCIFDVSKYH